MLYRVYRVHSVVEDTVVALYLQYLPRALVMLTVDMRVLRNDPFATWAGRPEMKILFRDRDLLVLHRADRVHSLRDPDDGGHVRERDGGYGPPTRQRTLAVHSN